MIDHVELKVYGILKDIIPNQKIHTSSPYNLIGRIQNDYPEFLNYRSKCTITINGREAEYVNLDFSKLEGDVLVEIFPKVHGNILDFFEGLVGAVGNLIGDVFNGVGAVIGGIGEGIGAIVGGVFDFIGGLFGGDEDNETPAPADIPRNQVFSKTNNVTRQNNIVPLVFGAEVKSGSVIVKSQLLPDGNDNFQDDTGSSEDTSGTQWKISTTADVIDIIGHDVIINRLDVDTTSNATRIREGVLFGGTPLSVYEIDGITGDEGINNGFYCFERGSTTPTQTFVNYPTNNFEDPEFIPGAFDARWENTYRFIGGANKGTFDFPSAAEGSTINSGQIQWSLPTDRNIQPIVATTTTPNVEGVDIVVNTNSMYVVNTADSNNPLSVRFNADLKKKLISEIAWNFEDANYNILGQGAVLGTAAKTIEIAKPSTTAVWDFEVQPKLFSATQVLDGSTDVTQISSSFSFSGWNEKILSDRTQLVENNGIDNQNNKISFLNWRISSQYFGNQIPKREYILAGQPVLNLETGISTRGENPAYQLYDMITDSTYGLNLPATSVDETSFINVARYCDSSQLISLVTRDAQVTTDTSDWTLVNADIAIDTSSKTIGGTDSYRVTSTNSGASATLPLGTATSNGVIAVDVIANVEGGDLYRIQLIRNGIIIDTAPQGGSAQVSSDITKGEINFSIPVETGDIVGLAFIAFSTGQVLYIDDYNVSFLNQDITTTISSRSAAINTDVSDWSTFFTTVTRDASDYTITFPDPGGGLLPSTPCNAQYPTIPQLTGNGDVLVTFSARSVSGSWSYATRVNNDPNTRRNNALTTSDTTYRILYRDLKVGDLITLDFDGPGVSSGTPGDNMKVDDISIEFIDSATLFQKRWTSNFNISGPRTAVKTFKQVLERIGGSIYKNSEDKIALDIDRPTTIDKIIGTGDIIGTNGITINSISDNDKLDQMRVEFPSRQDFHSQQFVTIQAPDTLVVRNVGTISSFNTTNKEEAFRIGSRSLYQSRYLSDTYVVNVGPSYHNTNIGDVVLLADNDNARRQFSGKISFTSTQTNYDLAKPVITLDRPYTPQGDLSLDVPNLRFFCVDDSGNACSSRIDTISMDGLTITLENSLRLPQGDFKDDGTVKKGIYDTNTVATFSIHEGKTWIITEDLALLGSVSSSVIPRMGKITRKSVTKNERITLVIRQYDPFVFRHIDNNTDYSPLANSRVYSKRWFEVASGGDATSGTFHQFDGGNASGGSTTQMPLDGGNAEFKAFVE